MDMTPGNPPRSGLWLAAFLILLIGGMISSVIYFYPELENPLQPHSYFWLSVFITALAVGITLICASSRWWLNR
jgi:hypothetical protein